MSKTKYILSVILLGILVSTAGACTTVEDAIADPSGRTWILESYGESADLQAVIEGSRITATFDSDEGQVRGSAGCNHYFGGYDIDGSDLSISQIGATEMYCMEPEGVMEQEGEYLDILSNSETYQIDGSQLTIEAGNDVLIFNEE